ncbi:hypothetical protein [Kiritimatiella glycovorans]|uniref:Pectate lyase superfamily protein domain-containing protein n=1 Tax=Kiritimatiella glycovorans TaxID=1307763 RepID=A0A0G3EJ30_9BACT|nr:hypothetical protein [Kiritimatiella glycovorans]AKJ64194.1 hypothetical protein L21SP4_00932 [Kiritimatiella glycovorans]
MRGGGLIRRCFVVWALTVGAVPAMQEADVTAFGAVPGDGADDTAAFQQALDYLIADGGGYLEIPAGDYHLGTCLFVRVPNAQVSEGYIRLYIRGAGRHATRLIGGDTSGLLFFETTINGMNLTLRDFTLQADAPDRGPAISIINPDLGVRAERALILERITIGRTAPMNSFSKGVRAHGQWRALFRQVQIVGADRRTEGHDEESVLFDDCFYIDNSVRMPNESVHKTGVGSSTNGLTADPWRFYAARDPADAETPRFFTPGYARPGGGYPAEGVLYYGNHPGLDALVSVDFDEFEGYDALTLSAELSAYDTGGMGIGFGADPELAFGEDESALWIESAGANTIATNVDVRLCLRHGGTNLVLETLTARDAPNAAGDEVTLVYDRANNTVTGSWDDGSNGPASFELHELDALGFTPLFRRVKFEVLDEQGGHGNFPRIGHVRLTGRGAVWRMTRGIDQDGFYGGRMAYCSVRNADTAYDWSTDGTGEGGLLHDSLADGCRVGMIIATPGQEPGVHVSDNVLRAEEAGVVILRKRVGKVMRNRIEPLAARGEGFFRDIELFNCQAMQVGGNTFSGSTSNRVHLIVDGHGSAPIPHNAIRSEQIDFYDNVLALPIRDAVLFRGPKIYEVHLRGNTGGGAP